MSSMKKMGAMESMFDPEQTTASLLEAVKANVAETIKTVDAAATLENKLSEEAAQFNACLTTMSNAIRKCERGEISREEMLAECAPCVTALKEKCVALKLADVKATGDDITEEEIAMLREYIVGCKDIVADRKNELQDCPVEGASEGLLAGLANFEPATEANMVKEIRKSTEAKTANELYKQAKKLYGLGSKEKALEYLKKAQKLYENCLEKAEKAAKMVDVERTVKSVGVEDKFNKKLTDNVAMAYVIEYFEDRIDSCEALEMQWSNKAGKSTYAETKAQLKAERKQARADRKAARKAERDAKKNAGSEEESAVEALGMTEDEFIDAMESLMDTMELDLAMEAAMEAEGEGEEGAAKSASGIGAKFRAAFAKLKKGKNDGDQAAINEGREEIKEAADELAEAEQAAETPEEKKRLSKAAKIGLAAGAAAAATIGITAGLAVRAKKMAESGADVKGANKTLVSLYDTVAKAAQNVGDAAASRRVGKEEQRQEKAASDKERADRYLVNKVEAERQKKIAAMNKEGNKYEKKKAKGSLDSVLTAMAFGLEGVMVEDEDVDDDYIEPAEGKAFDDEDLIETATEAAIAVMMAEDGIDDSDLI